METNKDDSKVGFIELSEEELEEYKTGEAITLTAVMAILAIAITAIVAYNLFKSKKGTTQIPGGWKFTWE